LDVVDAMTEAPDDTRAHGRSQLVKRALDRNMKGGYHFDWSGVALGRESYYEMPDPFDTYKTLIGDA
jgi:hypothetical protein